MTIRFHSKEKCYNEDDGIIAAVLGGNMLPIENTIYEVMVYINLNLFERITLDLLSDRFSYSKYHLHRKFKAVSGMTLNEYIRRRRIETSIYFLFANPDADISEVAGYCGFSSATYSREFRKAFNRTPKQWRNIYKKGVGFGQESNICKNYERFLDYDDNGIPSEIKNLDAVEIGQKKLAVRIVYGNYYDRGIMKAVWNEVKKQAAGNGFTGVPLNSPAVTDISRCLYLAGFESERAYPGLSGVTIEGGCYIRASFQGDRGKLGDIYTWILKYYLPQKGLKYDYRPQLQEFDRAPDFDQNETGCRLYIPIRHT